MSIKDSVLGRRMKYRDIALSIKADDLTPQGKFTGYASVFGAKDSYGDIVMPGAFKASLQRWKSEGALPPLLFSHDSRQPIGIHTAMTEDSKGLLVEGQLAIDAVEKARESFALLKMGAIKGMSIGYVCTDWTVDSKAKSTELNTIDLWENSLVVFPACPGAGVDSVKNVSMAGTLPSDEEFREYLQEAGFSKEQADVIVRKGFDALLKSHSPAAALADLINSRYGAQP